MIDVPIKNMVGVTEDYLIDNYPDFYNNIFKIKIENINLSERIWLYKNELNIIPTCINCNGEVKYRNLTVGYRKYCCKKCSAQYTHKDYDIKTKRMKNMLTCNYDSEIRKNMTEKSNRTKMNFSKKKKLEINNKRRKNINAKYGVDIISQNKDIIQKIKNSVIKTKNLNKDIIFSKRIKNFGYEMISCNIDDMKLKSETCSHEFDIHRSLFNQRNRFGVTVCTICNPINNHISDFQNKITQFISSVYNDEIIINKKIGKFEIDIFLPKMNIGFECNGLWWHSDIYREKEYHINKLNYFKNQNITIINIWEDWWKFKNEIIKSIISNKINKTIYKTFARKTEIKIIKNEKIIKNFLNLNHIQGYKKSKINIGLYYNDELLSLMTFVCNSCDDWEIVRYCTKLNTVVVGGASKMFKYFIETYNFSSIITLADLSIYSGKLYEKLNMNYDSITTPDYTYFHKDHGIRLNKYNFRKDILVKQGFDPTKNVYDIMRSRNYYRIYDCGNLKYIYIKR